MAPTLVEATLEAWDQCRPDGMTFSKEQLPQRLPSIAVMIPGGLDSPESARRLNELFNSKVPGSPPMFCQMLKVHEDKVHFLYFWQAFGEASRIVLAGATAPNALPAAGSAQCLSAELERFRDRVLQKLEVGGLRLPALELIAEVHSAAASSLVPSFWREVLENCGALELVSELSLEELTAVVLSWLHDAGAWMKSCGNSQPSRPSSSSSRASTKTAEAGLPVFLHIYDVSQEESVQKLNRVLAHRLSPLKFGGVFHAGVEVNGLEWCYGFSENETIPGVCCVEPKAHPQHHYRQTIRLRRTLLSSEDVMEIVGSLLEEYPGDDYDLLRRNCCHFADDLCRRLGVGGIPYWVHRLARIGAGIDGVVQVAQGLGDRFRGTLLKGHPKGAAAITDEENKASESASLRSSPGGYA
eukprot:TRINITY_DN109895_c0_g1_i1.p1 TRINITY_DN109895_c0_g1~~TRINITY_DN109895_c0_g1_i1.p1  ORF type:complete len:412 (-),score=97.73 TRINITY_DN109895_c0_g1_i1:23-1258(-)